MDLTKYRNLFLEEATEHLAEMSRSLLELEKTPEAAAAIDNVFRAAHSIKGMAASLGYDAITEVAHRLEDRMGESRSVGRLDPQGLELLFRGLEVLEGMVEQVREGGEPPALGPELAADLAGSAPPVAEEPEKKARRWT